MSTILQLWKWEWKKKKRNICVRQIVIMVLSMLVFLLYRLFKWNIIPLMLQIKQLPEELYVFMGITAGTETGNQNFYLVSLFVLAGVVILILTMHDMAESFYADERCGMMALMTNQWYSRKEILLAKYFWNMAVFFLGILVWTLENVLLIAVGSLSASQIGSGIALLFRACVWMLLVGALLLTVICFLTICPKDGKRIDVGERIAILLGVSLLLGNLYKIRDAIGWLLRLLKIKDQIVHTIGGWLDWLYWISPLSWLNPFTSKDIFEILIQAGICILGTALLFFFAMEKYKIRKIVS